MGTAATGSGVRYLADTAASQFVVQAFASGMLSTVAHSPKIAIRDWTGEISFDPQMPSRTSVRVRINTGSLAVLDELPDSDKRELYRVMNQEVVETARFPEIAFDSSRVKTEQSSESQYRCEVDGMLTLHGVTNAHSFSAQAVFGVDTVRTYGDFKIRQTDFGIKIAAIAGGAVKLQDQLKCTFYILARKQGSG